MQGLEVVRGAAPRRPYLSVTIRTVARADDGRRWAGRIGEARAVTRENLGRIFAWAAAAGFVGTAVLHGTGYRAVATLAAGSPGGLDALVPAMWLAFSLDLAVVGLIIAVVAWKRSRDGGLILALGSLCPFGAAVLQIVFLGFIPPTAILLVVGGVTLAAAGLLGRGSRAGTAGAA